MLSVTQRAIAVAVFTVTTAGLATACHVEPSLLQRERSSRCRIAPVHDTVGPGTADLCRHAEHAVVGVVESGESRRGTEAEGRLAGRVVTDFRFRVTDVLAGLDSAGDVLDLTLEGGDLDGVTGRVSDSPWLMIDNSYLLFLSDRFDQPRPSFLAYRRMQDVVDEHALEGAGLRPRWQDVCAANPEGVHQIDITHTRLSFLLDDCPLRLH